VTPGPSVCAYYCPSGTLVTSYTSSTGTVYSGEYCEVAALVGPAQALAPGLPTEYGAKFWGAKLKLNKKVSLFLSRVLPVTSCVYSKVFKTKCAVTNKGPALKFHVQAGINNGSYLKSLTLTLPKGLTFTPQEITVAVDGPNRTLTKNTLTLRFRGGGVKSFLVYLKKRSMLETTLLRQELASGRMKKVHFGLTVTTEAGVTTTLSFSTPPIT